MVPTPIIYSVQKLGSQGDQVRSVQMTLPIWCQKTPLLLDGYFGQATKDAVMLFQQEMNLPADGVVGKTTASALGVWRNLEKGFDASHWNNISWSEIPEDYKFAIFKATEGATYVDPSFYTNCKYAKDSCLTLGAYHYTKFLNSYFKEAANFINAVVNADSKFTDLFLDLEYRESSLSADEILEWVLGFVDTVKRNANFPTRVGIYTSSNYLREVGLQYSSGLEKYSLWACDVNSQPIVLPWKSCAYWQYSISGSVPWSNTPLDLNYKILE